MTIRGAIETVDRLSPNQYENIDKVRWLSELDGVVYLEIELPHEAHAPAPEQPWVRTRVPLEQGAETTEPEAFTGYPEDVDFETVLRVPWPYDEIYRWYLEMKIADAQGEMTRYNNAMAKYSAYYTAYQSFYNRSRMPKIIAAHVRL